MSDHRRERIEELFDQLADEPPERWAALLEASCGEYQELRNRLLELLEAEQRGHPILQATIGSLAYCMLEAEAEPEAPRCFGRYVIRKFLDKGGMGAVYLADREGLGDQVAVKFLHNPSRSRVREELFDKEQRTLASLNHKYIARLYDSGIADGRPWFAMEYVQGDPITEYCRAQRLGLRERLQLFRCACEAVGHAHGKLIVHSDLKPANILVNTDGEVRLLDFGIASHVNNAGELDENVEERFLSVKYASPEQIQQQRADVQTDVYALGVVLWEMLHGNLPAEGTGTDPGARGSASFSGAARVHASKSDWQDLDILCAAAMHPDRTQRYATVGELIRDLDHFLKLEPLAVRTKTVRYQANKFIRRNWRILSVTAAALVLIASLIGFFTLRLLASRDRAVALQARTDRLYQMMLNLFGGDDSEAAPARDLRVVNLLERGARGAQSLDREPNVQASLRLTLGQLYLKLGHADRAEPLLIAAWKTQRATLGPQHPDTIDAQLALAGLRIEQYQLPEAEKLIHDAFRAAATRNGPPIVEATKARALLGKLFVARGDTGDYERAITELKNAAELLPATYDSGLSEALGDLANAYYSLGKTTESENANLRALALDRQLFGANHPNTGVDLFNLGNIALDRADYGKAEALFREALGIYTNWYEDPHPKIAYAVLMVGRAVAYQGRLMEAAALYQHALDETRATYGEQHIRYAVALSLSGDLAVRQYKLAEAETAFQHSADIFKQRLGERSEYYLQLLSNLATVRIAAKQYKPAEHLLRTALNGLKAAVPEQRYTALAEVRLGAALAGEKRYQEAKDYAESGYNHLLAKMGPKAEEVTSARQVLSAIDSALHEADKAKKSGGRG